MIKVSHVDISVGIQGVSGGCSQGVAGAAVSWRLDRACRRCIQGGSARGQAMLVVGGQRELRSSPPGAFPGAVGTALVIGQILGQGTAGRMIDLESNMLSERIQKGKATYCKSWFRWRSRRGLLLGQKSAPNLSFPGRLTTKGHEGTFQDDGNILYLHYGDGHVTIFLKTHGNVRL